MKHPSKVRMHVFVDPETRDYLRARFVETGVRPSELIRRAVNMARFVDSAKAGKS